MPVRPVLAMLALVASSAVGQERHFTVTRDGRPAGEFVLTTTRTDDGTVTVQFQADAGPADWSYRGTETWKDGRLLSLDGSGSIGGRRGTVALRPGPDGYALKAGVKEVTVRGEAWPNSFAVLPDSDRPLVVDVVTGDVLRAKVERLGADRVTVGERPVPATRYRVTAGGAVTELWFDRERQLVRRTWLRDGHRLVAEWAKNPRE